MYQLVTAQLARKGKNSLVQTVNISSTLMYDLMYKYDRGYIELSNPSLAQNIRVNLLNLFSQNLPIPNVTFSTWLGSIGNRSIQGTPVASVEQEKTSVVYQDILNKYFMVDLIHPIYDTSVDVSYGTKTAGYIVPTIGSQHYFDTHSVFSVNGILHYHVPYKDGVKVYDAGNTLRCVGDNTVGRLNFTAVGKVTLIPLKGKVFPVADKPYEVAAIVDAKMSLTGKSVLASLGGYLHGEHDVLSVVNADDGLVLIKMNEVDPKNKITRSHDHLKMDTVDAASDWNAKVLAWLNLSQSFLIVVDTNQLQIRYNYPEYSGLPGYYRDQSCRMYPMVGSSGRLLDYLYQKDDLIGVYHCQTDIDYRNNWLDVDDPEHAALMSGGHYSSLMHNTARFLIMETLF